MILLIVILAVLGFVLSLVCNGVLKTADSSVLKSMGVIFVWGLAVTGVNYALAASELPGIITSLTSLAASFLILAGLLMLAVQATFKQAALMSAIFSVLLFLIGLGLASCSDTGGAGTP